MNEELASNNRIKKLLKGALFGGLFGILSDAVLLLIFWGASPLLAPANFIFSFNQLYLYQQQASFSGALLLSLYPLEYAILGVLLVFLLDKNYRIVTKCIVLIVFSIIVSIPYFIYQSNSRIISDINKDFDIKTCFSFQATPQMNQCFFNLGVVTNNIDTCRQIKDSYVQNDCVLRIANNTKDLSLCIIATEGSTVARDTCVANIAIAKNDVEPCLQYVGSFEKKFDCIYKIAVNKGDKLLCENIKLPNDNIVGKDYLLNFKNRCLSEIK